jgi:anti-anti-sigma factor
MEITVSSEQGRVPVKVFHIVGDVDTESYEQLQTKARQEINAGTRYIVLDLAEVPYISSYGIRAISQIFNWLRDSSKDESDSEISQGVRAGTYQSHHLILVNPSSRVMKVLKETGLDMYVHVDHDVKAAVSSF